MHAVGLKEEAGELRENLCRHKENVRMLGIKPASCEVSVLTTVSPQYKTGRKKIEKRKKKKKEEEATVN